MEKKKMIVHIERELAPLRVEWRYDDDPEWIYYCTNNHGEGIFEINLKENNRSQRKGTLALSFAGMDDEQIIKALTKATRGGYEIVIGTV